MICNKLEHGWEVIYQRAHALLSAKLLFPLDRSQDPQWYDTLNAVAQHDHGWQEWESLSTLNSAGEPRNFLDTPAEESERQGRRAVLRARHQSVWGGLLVAHHIVSLYKESEESRLQELVEEMNLAREEWRRMLGIELQEEEQAYEFLSWADTLSLQLCLNRPDERLGPVRPSLRGEKYSLQGSGDTRYLSPWPYPCESLSVSVEAFSLKQDVFETERSLARALSCAALRRKSWTLKAG